MTKIIVIEINVLAVLIIVCSYRMNELKIINILEFKFKYTCLSIIVKNIPK